MKKLKLTLIPICIGIALLFFSWYLSYPISIDSPYDFEYDHISYFYWVSLPILFASFFIVAINTKKNTLKFIMIISTVLLIYSPAYFHYMIPGSDSHLMIGLTEYFSLTLDLSPRIYGSYYQWPIFFILNIIAIFITGFKLRYIQFILYCIINIVITSFLYFYTSQERVNKQNGYIAIIAFYIISFYFFNYQCVPYTFSIILLLMLLYLDRISEKREVIISMLIIFYILTDTHIIVPVFFIIYSFFMYIMKKDKKHLNLFILTLVIYILIQSHNYRFQLYIRQLKIFHFLEIEHRIETTLSSPIARQPYMDIIAQFFSRTVVITTMIITGLGFFILLLKKEIKKTDYGILLTGISFIPSLIISSRYYWNLFWRAFPLLFIPISLGASYLYESKFKKYFKTIFIILLLLFTFTIMRKNFFYDKMIFSLTIKEYQNAKFLIDNINYNTTNYLLSHYTYMTYFRTRVYRDIIFRSDLLSNFHKDINKDEYIALTVGLGKSFLKANFSVEKTFTEFEINHFNLIYNSGDFSYIFHNELER